MVLPSVIIRRPLSRLAALAELPATNNAAWWRLCLAVLIACIYANTLSVPFLFDDKSSIAENESLRSFSTIFLPPSGSGVTVSGRPLLNATLALNYAIGGERVEGYHLFNIALHIANAWLLFGLLARCFRLPSLRLYFAGGEVWLAGWMAAVWASHPLQTESVTYIIQRAESLVSFFYLLMFYCFVRSRQSAAERGWLALSVLACALGMASKEVMATAPIAIMAFDIFFVADSWRSAGRERWRYYAILCGTWLILGGCIANSGMRGGTVGAETAVTVWRYLLTQSSAIIRYLRLVIFPVGLVFDHGRHLAAGLEEVGASLLLLGGMMIGLAWAWIRHQSKVAWTGTMFFLVLAPSSSIVPILSQTVAEHRMYLALALVVVLPFTGLYRLLGRKTFWVGAIVTIIFAGLAVHRNRVYRSSESLWQDTTEKRPDNARAWLSLALTYAEQGRSLEAKPLLERAMRIEPESIDIGADYADVLVKLGELAKAEEMYCWVLKAKPDQYSICYNFGTLLLDLKRYQEAETLLLQALNDKKMVVKAYYNIGNCRMALGRDEEARASFRQAIQKDRKMGDAYVNLATLLLKAGKYEEALTVVEEATQAGVEMLALSKTRALSLVGLGRAKEAIASYRQMIASNASDADLYADFGMALANDGQVAEATGAFRLAITKGYGAGSQEKARALRVSLALCLQTLGAHGEAVEVFRQALSLEPDNSALRYLTAQALLKAGCAEEAVTALQEAMRSMEPTAEMHNDLGVAFLQLRRLVEARTEFELAVRLRPDFPEAKDNLRLLDQNQR